MKRKMKKHPLIIALLASFLLISSMSCTLLPVPPPFLTTGQMITVASDTKGFADEITSLVLASCRINNDPKNFMTFLQMVEPDGIIDIKKGTTVEIVEEPSQLVAEVGQSLNGIVKVKLPDNSLWFIWW